MFRNRCAEAKVWVGVGALSGKQLSFSRLKWALRGTISLQTLLVSNLKLTLFAMQSMSQAIFFCRLLS